MLRVSYARTLETPFNENLVLASNGCNDPVINALESTSSPCVTNSPLGAGWRNEFHAGLQQALNLYRHLLADEGLRAVDHHHCPVAQIPDTLALVFAFAGDSTMTRAFDIRTHTTHRFSWRQLCDWFTTL